MLSTFSHTICQHYPLPSIQFSAVNLSSCSIKILNTIPPKLLFISQLYLDNNLIQSLSGIQQFMNLQILSVNFNFISQLSQLSRINNKFLMRELSFIGNPIQRSVNGYYWFQREGFYNLVVVNDVGAIGKVNARRCFVFGNDNRLSAGNNNNNDNYSFEQSSSRNKQNTSYHQQQMSQQSSRRNQHNARYHNQSAMQGMSQASNEGSSQIVYLTKREVTLNSSKRVKEFQSTGDTRKQRLSSYRVENSPGGMSSLLQTSPNFNYPLNQFHHNEDYSYRKSLPNRKVTEFNLYPVDQQMTRSRRVVDGKSQRVRWDIHEDDLEQQQIVDDNNSSNSFSKIKPLNRTIQYNKRVNPFKQSPQHHSIKPRTSSSSFTTTQHLPAYRSQRYHLSDVNAKYKHWMNQCQQQQQQEGISQNSHQQQQESAFLLIQRQIPIYKEAISVAFYYRNLLEKVLRGLKSMTNKQVRIKSQLSLVSLSQPSHHKRQIQISDEFDNKQRFITEQQQMKHQHQQPFQQRRQQQQSIQLLRYAWMKIQLYSNYQKVMEKYHLSSGKKPK